MTRGNREDKFFNLNYLFFLIDTNLLSAVCLQGKNKKTPKELFPEVKNTEGAGRDPAVARTNQHAYNQRFCSDLCALRVQSRGEHKTRQRSVKFSHKRRIHAQSLNSITQRCEDDIIFKKNSQIQTMPKVLRALEVCCRQQAPPGCTCPPCSR